jgi:hypothetical protein
VPSGEHAGPFASPVADLLELESVAPVVAEVVGVVQDLAALGQRLVEADLDLGGALVLAFLDVERIEEELGVAIPDRGAEGEPVQVAVVPTKQQLDQVMHLVEHQGARQLDPPPDRRLGPGRVDPEHERLGLAPGPPSRRAGVGSCRHVTLSGSGQMS